MAETLGYKVRRRLARAMANLDRCSGPRAIDPYAPRPARSFHAQTVDVTDPATGFTVSCTLRVPQGEGGPLPVVVHTKPPDWAPSIPSPDGGFIADRLAAAGYLAITLHHGGSDRVTMPRSVFEVPDKVAYVNERLYDDAGRARRVADLRHVLDRLEAWSHDGPLRGRLDLSRIGLSGYSHGALAVCQMMGQRIAPDLADRRDPRIRAAIAYSKMGLEAEQPPAAFESIDRPGLYITGTLDFSRGNSLVPRRKLAVYDRGTATRQYALTLRHADHHTLGGARLAGGNPSRRELLCHQWLHAVTLAFWDAYLRDDPAARRWLDEDCARLLGRDGRLERR